MNPIVHACRERGAFTLSAGTLEPAIVLERLLAALQVLDPDGHRAFVSDPRYVAIPTVALHDELHRWWGSDVALQLVERLILAIDHCMARHGFVCGLLGTDHFVLEPLASAPAPGAGPGPPPRISALRARVRREDG